ncbi:SIS domain-containing protein [Candidatus Methanodesulfokora washburnensis]|jgi:glucosamine--fructose-6-phosphate aminotransferase (isomerizing)|uniref:SIS domain-containing protein n=2 Tax=Candidatus Methanodesulfokora washburnensis TaxID=2478471 RepID=A0A429GCI7_9CREN|nr:SIS domain-containing protein [Candidatus Methanodesulfokores washburnensis]
MMRGERTRREILEQPDAFAKTLSSTEEEVKRAADAIKGRFIYATGSGTSFHAALVLQRAMSKIASERVISIAASEIPYWLPDDLKETVLLAFSQSGESKDVLIAVDFYRRHGGEVVVSVTNTEGSTLDRLSDITIITRAGKEESIAATKTYTSQLAASFLLSICTAERKRCCLDDLREELRKIPEAMRNTIEMCQKRVVEVAEEIKDRDIGFILGSGSNYPTALEGALKLRETSNLHYEGFAAREFLHGPIQLVSRHTPVIIISNGLQEVIDRVKVYEAPVIEIGGDVPVIKVRDEFSPAVNIIPLQLLAYNTSLLRGLDPDSPEKLSKVVR